MRLAIVNLIQGGLSGGYRKYLDRILPLLADDSRVQCLDVFLPPGMLQGEANRRVTRTWPAADMHRGYRWLRDQIRQTSPEAVFIPTARWLNFGRIPIVTMVRNMEPLIIPFNGNPFREGIKNLLRAYEAKRACQRAIRVIAVSQYVKDFLHASWNIEPEKIGVVYHGVEAPPDQSTLRTPIWAHKQKLGNFIFTAGSIRPARGLEDLIYAFGELDMRGLNYKLVIAGAIDPLMGNYKNKLEKLSLKLDIASRIVWPGHLSPEEMSWSYYNCAAFVMTSRAEACPNIALEAMAHGCVCISTEAPPMPEFFQEVAAYYPPTNGEALSKVIQSVLSWDNERKKTMADRARQRAAQFSWDLTAEKTIEELQKAL